MKCPTCGGSGYAGVPTTWNTVHDPQRCRTCHGTGQIVVSRTVSEEG
ncbi:MAG: hypothetical protein ACREUQ_09800 [Burkholderiales bacterium]